MIGVPNLVFQWFFFDAKCWPFFRGRAHRCFLEKIVVLIGMLGQVSINLEDKLMRYLVFVGEIEEADRPLQVAVEATNDVSEDLV